MLYDGGIKVLKEAIRHIDNEEPNQAHESLIKGQEIIMELHASLNHDAGELTDHLGRLYDYMYRRLIEANLQKDRAMIEEVLGFLQDLRTTWNEAMKLAKEKEGKVING